MSDRKPNKVCCWCGKPYYVCMSSIALSETRYVYKVNFCSPECYAEYLERSSEPKEKEPKNVIEVKKPAKAHEEVAATEPATIVEDAIEVEQESSSAHVKTKRKMKE